MASLRLTDQFLLRFRIGPRPLVFLLAGLDGLDNFVVFQNVDTRQRLGADDGEFQLRRLVRLELIAHQVRAALHVGENVIRSGVNMPALQSFENPFSRQVLHVDIAVADVR